MEYKDRQVGLTLFGILLILFGLGGFAMAALMVIGAAVGRAAPGGPPMRMMIPVSLLYVTMSVATIILGIGSIRARRWARALILAFSWIWLITGVLSAVAVGFMFPKMAASMSSDSAEAIPIMAGCMAVILGLFFILLPILFILFYRSPNVRATVEARDPVPRWTDDIPLPLLAYGVALIFGAVSMVFYAFAYPALPLGPWIVRGIWPPLIMLAMAALCFFIGSGMLRRMPAAWWTALAAMIIFAPMVFLASKTDFVAFNREIGLAGAPEQVEAIQSMYASPVIFIWTGAIWISSLAFLIYLRRYFQNMNRMDPPSTGMPVM